MGGNNLFLCAFDFFSVQSVKDFYGCLMARSKVKVIVANSELSLQAIRAVYKMKSSYNINTRFYYLGLLKVVQSSSHFHNPAITKPNNDYSMKCSYPYGYWALVLTIKHDHLPDFSVMQSGGVGNLQIYSMIPQTLL